MTPREQEAANRVESTYLARERWMVTKPGAEPIEVIFNPAQTQAEVLQRYPGAGVVPIAP